MQGFFRQYLLLHKLLVSKLNEILGEYGLCYAPWTILYYLKANGPASLVVIAAYFHVKKPVITRTVQGLEAAGLVRPLPSQDKREKIIQLTEAGESVYAAGRRRIDHLEENLLASFPSADKEAACQMLLALRDKLTKTGGTQHG